ncbi:DNA recombinase [Sorangium cellulosum]|uniref:DNA recombinase n=1 Tax=Sorangium cellulosum TaxID=56 RepID=A0A2L0F2Y1_SORCE|nr:recombinase family protein [Sorangium cellulosum]AUX45910.1 DNA recombinase [Sorangium cellulosum]
MSERMALYARVSTSHQEQEQTIASQIAALEHAAAAMGVTVPSERRYLDEGISGSRLDRPGLDALRDAAAEGLIDGVLVYCPDRLARNYVHQHVLIEELNRHGVAVHFVEHPLGERAEDRLLAQMQGVIAEYERAKILERTRRGRLHKLRTGQMLPFQGNPPYGYAILERDRDVPPIVVINEVEAQHVRDMFRWVIEEGLSTRAIAKRLNKNGVAPRKAEFWTWSGIYNVLTNPCYIGQAGYGKWESCEPKRPKKPGSYRKRQKSSMRRRPEDQWIIVPIPPLIEEKTLQQVRSALAKNKLTSTRNVQWEYLLRTLVVCGECGRRMNCIHKAPRAGRHAYDYYVCPSDAPEDRGRLQRCPARNVRRDDLDDVVWKAVVAWLQQPEMLQHEIETWRTSQQAAAQRTRDRTRLEKTERQLAAQVERLVDAYMAGAITAPELKARRERLEASKQATRARIEELAVQDQDQARLDRLAEDLDAFAATLRVGLDKLDFADRQHIVRLLIERVVVTGSQINIEHAIPLSGRFSQLRPSHQAAVLVALEAAG